MPGESGAACNLSKDLSALCQEDKCNQTHPRSGDNGRLQPRPGYRYQSAVNEAMRHAEVTRLLNSWKKKPQSTILVSDLCLSVLRYLMEVKFLARQNSESLRDALQELSLKNQECIRYVCDVLCRLLVQSEAFFSPDQNGWTFPVS